MPHKHSKLLSGLILSAVEFPWGATENLPDYGLEVLPIADAGICQICFAGFSTVSLIDNARQLGTEAWRMSKNTWELLRADFTGVSKISISAE